MSLLHCDTFFARLPYRAVRCSCIRSESALCSLTCHSHQSVLGTPWLACVRSAPWLAACSSQCPAGTHVCMSDLKGGPSVESTTFLCLPPNLIAKQPLPTGHKAGGYRTSRRQAPTKHTGSGLSTSTIRYQLFYPPTPTRNVGRRQLCPENK
jgi:hypothetical protein